ncbi:helix-turn-helix transcriptional regulator [Halobacillus litoralis]|uniref:helix-turn-helix transcriptional regulator n=1 Tax=Halobacillus litoralis TaxID=45668 RepID=UPI001CD5256D|nr:helix-turn-helix transcriptional regulator [Halobacillus litoralis]MCA0971187.1 helix-turn-helix transcriptional regulator [Halobacillus litoralis]
MEYGKVLRFHRVKQGLTQNQLADGIISPAYLSKIENDQTVPTFEVLELLYERLGLDFHDSSNSHPSKEKLKEWYEAIVFKDKEKARTLKDELLQQKETHDNHHLYIFFELFRIRYLLLESEIEEAYKAWKDVKQFRDTFDNKMAFYYHLCTGLLKYYRGDFDESYQELMQSKHISNSINPENWEFSDLYYLLALSTSQANHISASVFYVNQALEIYQSHYDLAKSADCHILQGINYSRLKNYAKALENLHLAKKIALQTRDKNQLRLVFINIGTLESRIENHEAAIENYEKSLEYYDSNSKYQNLDFLTTILGLIVEHYRMKDTTGCLKWINEGKNILYDYPHKEFELHFEVFSKLIRKDSELESYLENEAIPFFQDKKEHIYVIRYSMFLADILEEQRMYKKSSFYLRLAIELLNKHSHLGGILL